MENNKLKLNFNKETIVSLGDNEMNDVKGGFTYFLSCRKRCRWSKQMIKEGRLINDNDCKVMWKES